MLRRLPVIAILSCILTLGTSAAFAKQSVVGEKSLPSKIGKTPPATSTPPKLDKTQSMEAAPAIDNKLEPAEIPPPKAHKNVGYDKGFFIQSDDEKFSLRFNGYAQYDFEFDRIKGQNTFGFQIRRAELVMSGNLATKKLLYLVKLDFTKFKDSLLQYAYMNYTVKDYFEVRFGEQTIPWIRQQIESASNQQFVERSLASVEFLNVQDVDSDGDKKVDKQTRNAADIGIMLHGKPFHNKMEYQVGIFNGSGINSTNFNNDLLYSARAVYNIKGDFGYEEGDYDHLDHPAVFFGGSGNYNVRDFTNDKISQLGAETGLKYKGLAMQGEFFYRHDHPGDSTLSAKNDYGYYAQVGYFAVPKRLEFAARASQVFLQGLQNDKAEFGLGINGYIYKKYLKVQTDYSVLPTNTKNGVDTAQRWRLRLQTKF